MAMFKDELDFFIRNQEGLVKQYAGKALVIKGNEVLGVHDTPLEAYMQVQQDKQLGEVMIQVCAPGPDAYAVTIN